MESIIALLLDKVKCFDCTVFRSENKMCIRDRSVRKMPQESAEEIASAWSVVGFSELLESTSESQSARKKYNFFQKSA